MSLTQTHPRSPFGTQLAQWPRQWQAAGAMLLDWPALRWLMPQVPVRLRRADGGVSHWRVARGRATPVATAPAGESVDAFELPTDRVLERHLTLPRLSAADVAQAVQLDVAAASPFGADQTVWGFKTRPIDEQSIRVDAAITSRQHVEQSLRAAGPNAQPMPELWVVPSAAGQVMYPIVLRGFGEARRQQRARQGLTQRLVLAALALLVLAALLVSPTALQRARASQAQQSFAALQQQAAPQLAQREAMVQSLERVQAVRAVLQQQLALAPALDVLTRTIPNGAWLTALRADGLRLVLEGQADDAAALVQRLAAQPGVHDVRLASPATRGATAAKETFIIELRLDAQQFGPTVVSTEATS